MTGEHRRRTLLVELVQKKFEKLSQYAALLTSVIALAVAIWSLREAQIHDELSLQPGVSYVWHTSRADVSVGLFLENTGSGPARIEETRIYLDSRRVKEWRQLADMTANLYAKDKLTWHRYKQGYVLGQGKTIPFYYSKPEDVTDWVSFVDLIQRRVFVISTICTMYDKCHDVCSTADDKDCANIEKEIKKANDSS